MDIDPETAASRRLTARQTVLVAALFVGVLALLFLQYHHGIGVTSDSALFISTADSLLSGHGLTTSVGTLTTSVQVFRTQAFRTPLTHHPPLYPLLLAAGKAITGGFLSAATFLNFASFLCCFLAAYAFAVRQSGVGSAIATVCLLACSVTLYSVHYTVGTDGPAIPFLIAAMCWLGDFERSKRLRPLVLAALALAAGSLTRYAYLAFIPAACVVLLLDNEMPFRKRLRTVLLLAVIACAPALLAMFANMIWAGNATNRVLAFHLVAYGTLRDGADHLSTRLLPYRIPLPLRLMALLTVCVTGLVLAVRSPRKYGARITTVFLASYAVFIVVSTSLFDQATPFDERILAPAVVILCLHVGVVSGWLWLGRARWRAAAALLLVLAPVACGIRELAPRVATLYKFRERGSSLAKLKNDYRDIVPILRSMPSDGVIYSNVASEIYLISGKYARALPVVRGYTDARPRAEGEIAAQVGYLWDQVSGLDGLVVYRLRPKTLSDLAMISRDDLCRRVPLTERFHSDAFVVLAGRGAVNPQPLWPFTANESAQRWRAGFRLMPTDRPFIDCAMLGFDAIGSKEGRRPWSR